jgi:hypothetical protein
VLFKGRGRVGADSWRKFCNRLAQSLAKGK